MTIWIDADSCPRPVKNYTTQYGKENLIAVKFVANKEVFCDVSGFEMIIVKQEKDAADNFIFENSVEKDLVITRDILLASRLIEKNIFCMNDKGTVFSKDNIKNLLEDRNLDFQLAQLGLCKNKAKTWNEKDFSKFKENFAKTVKKILSD